MTLRCPLCHFALNKHDGVMVCQNKHNFDIARQGYVNLLPVQNKKSKIPGDNVEMIQSRRNFFKQGHYNSVSTKINQLAANLAARTTDEPIKILDAGCGEGFYLHKLKNHLVSGVSAEANYDFYGVDISKFAVRQATQYDKFINWIVASINDLPFFDASLNLLLCVFSNSNFKEFSRVLKKGGFVIFVSPGPNHLYSLKKIIYEKIFDHTVEDLLKPSEPYFNLVSSQRISYTIKLSSSGDIMNLLVMTPYYWRASPEAKSKIANLNELSVEVDMLVTVLSSAR